MEILVPNGHRRCGLAKHRWGHSSILADHRDFVQSFFLIADERARAFVDRTPEEWEREALAELKALFPTTREAVAYILEQFPIVKRRDEERYGEYRTKRVVLQYYDAMLEAIKRAA